MTWGGITLQVPMHVMWRQAAEMHARFGACTMLVVFFCLFYYYYYFKAKTYPPPQKKKLRECSWLCCFYHSRSYEPKVMRNERQEILFLKLFQKRMGFTIYMQQHGYRMGDIEVRWAGTKMAPALGRELSSSNCSRCFPWASQYILKTSFYGRNPKRHLTTMSPSASTV